MAITKKKNDFSVTAYQGDAKTLLAFNLSKARSKNLAGFTIEYQPDGLYCRIAFLRPAEGPPAARPEPALDAAE